ncbi:MAG: element excision factor XisH family protein [Gemmataceae bacterium]
MSARNIYHPHVLDALRSDGWTVTDDPLRLVFGDQRLYVDIGAERDIIGAERGPDRIAVEVQSFVQPSSVRALQEAVGQYQVYRTVMDQVDPERRLYLAVPERVQEEVLSDRFGQLIIRELCIKTLVFDEDSRKVIRWIE